MDATMLREVWGSIQAAGASIGLLLLAASGGYVLARLLFRTLRKVSGRTETTFDDYFVEHCARPAQYLMPALLLNFVAPALGIAGESWLGRIFTVLVIGTFAWFSVQFTRVLKDLYLRQFDIEVADNLRARKVYTQIEIVRKIAAVVIALIALAAVMLQFDSLREIGSGILASAGIAGLVLGLAAQRMLGNMLAGFQLAITQPIRVDDVVIVEGEWGRIEEITLTYVVVRIWDLRRLVVPISYFIEKPFQNWTRISADILGTVFVYVDYAVPIAEVRETLHGILEESEFWDGKVWRLHVTDSTDRCVELRALMSAVDSGSAWELRCEVREKLVTALQKRYPDGLPRIRTTLEKVPAELVA